MIAAPQVATEEEELDLARAAQARAREQMILADQKTKTEAKKQSTGEGALDIMEETSEGVKTGSQIGGPVGALIGGLIHLGLGIGTEAEEGGRASQMAQAKKDTNARSARERLDELEEERNV